MNIRKKLCKLTLLGLSVMMPASLFAMGEGIYLGGQIGYSNLNNTEKEVQTGPTTFVMTEPSNTGIAGRIFLGYNFNQYGALESGYTYYTPSTYEAEGLNPCNDDPTIQESSFDIYGKGMVPFANFNFYGKAGIAIVYQKQSGRLTSSTLSSCEGDDNSTYFFKPAVAIGVSYELSQSFQTDLSYTRIIGGGDLKSIDFIALGISYHFTDKYCGQFLC